MHVKMEHVHHGSARTCDCLFGDNLTMKTWFFTGLPTIMGNEVSSVSSSEFEALYANTLAKGGSHVHRNGGLSRSGLLALVRKVYGKKATLEELNAALGKHGYSPSVQVSLSCEEAKKVFVDLNAARGNAAVELSRSTLLQTGEGKLGAKESEKLQAGCFQSGRGFLWRRGRAMEGVSGRPKRGALTRGKEPSFFAVKVRLSGRTRYFQSFSKTICKKLKKKPL